MKINITAQDYFDELKLMEQQYGQEEDLYPWIYMLLQMAECKKKEKYKNDYKGVSIRDVHAGRKQCENAEDGIAKLIKEKFMQSAYPEFLFVDRESKNVLGCVEIKKLDDTNFDFVYDDKSEPVLWQTRIVLKSLEERESLKETLEQNYEKIIFCKNENKHKNKELYPLVIASNDKNKLKEIIDNHSKHDINNLDAIIGFSTGYGNDTELWSHLNTFNKVLYTNGKKYYYLVKENEDIKLKLLAHSVDSDEVQFKKLTEELSGINWHEAPYTPIVDN